MRRDVTSRSIHKTALGRYTVALITAAALLMLSACGSDNSGSATPGTGQNQPLTWDLGTWDHTAWT
jgi:hypothetical protein